jgi:hypothetical protein
MVPLVVKPGYPILRSIQVCRDGVSLAWLGTPGEVVLWLEIKEYRRLDRRGSPGCRQSVI